jgi:succinate-acetate transporter protein
VNGEQSTRIVLRPIGSPLPLGFAGLFVATLMLSGLQLGWLEPADGQIVAYSLLLFAAPAQLITSLYGYAARDGIAGTGMGILFATWLTAGVSLLSLPSGATSDGVGLLFVVTGAALLAPAISAARGKPLAAAVLTTAAARLALSGVYHLTSSGTWEDVAGWVGLVLAGLAGYAVFAFQLEPSRIPTFRKELATAEPGVRTEL